MADEEDDALERPVGAPGRFYKRDRLYRSVATFLLEGSVLILVFGIFEAWWLGKLTQTIAIESAALCIAFFAVGVFFELKR